MCWSGMETRALTDRSYSKFEKIIATIYLYCIIFRMISIFEAVTSRFGEVASFFDVLLNMFGLAVAFVNTRGRLQLGNSGQRRLFLCLILLVLYLNASSFIMACVIQCLYGSYAGETAFSGILGMEIYFFQYVFIIGYNMYISKMFCKEEIYKILDRLNIFLLLLGYYNVLIVMYGGAFKQILMRIDVLGVLYYETDSVIERAVLTANEPSNAAEMVCILIVPYLIAQAYRGWHRMRYLIFILLWLPVIACMQSTSAYLMLLASLVGVCVLNATEKKKKSTMILGTVMIALAVFAVSPGGEALADFVFDLFPEQLNIRYLISEKLFSQTSNGSTTSRSVPLYFNWGAFTEFPIFGVGDGLQGYFYNKYFPDFAFCSIYNREVMDFYAKAQSFNTEVQRLCLGRFVHSLRHLPMSYMMLF